MNYSNSPLIKYTNLSPHYTKGRTTKWQGCEQNTTGQIVFITPHCVVGQATAQRIGEIFQAKSRGASCNYGISTEGDIILIVDEANRSWCSSSRWNDDRAITFECASDNTNPYAFNEKVWKSLVALCVDICKRYGRSKLTFYGSLAETKKHINYDNPTEMILTAHRWYASTNCPGAWMYSREQQLCDEVNAILGSTEPAEEPTVEPSAEANPYTEPKRLLYYRAKAMMNGDDVKWVQWYLLKKGFFPNVKEVDGWFGKKTKAAVLAFQKSYFTDSKEWDGIVGEKTRNALKQ